MKWIKLNKKNPQLPKESCNCWIATSEGDVLLGKYNEYQKLFFWHREVTITHYMIIEEPIHPKGFVY